jgi:hypothetical protein
MWECIFALVRDIAEIYDLMTKPTSSLETADNKARVRELKLDAVKNFLDAIIGYSRIKPFLSVGQIGAVGTVTSIIGIYQLWE